MKKGSKDEQVWHSHIVLDALIALLIYNLYCSDSWKQFDSSGCLIYAWIGHELLVSRKIVLSAQGAEYLCLAGWCCFSGSADSEEIYQPGKNWLVSLLSTILVCFFFFFLLCEGQVMLMVIWPIGFPWVLSCCLVECSIKLLLFWILCFIGTRAVNEPSGAL